MQLVAEGQREQHNVRKIGWSLEVKDVGEILVEAVVVEEAMSCGEKA